MGTDLVGKHDYWSTNRAWWANTLELAFYFGWQPQGTEPPAEWEESRDGPWDGDYMTNDRQYVTIEDANALAVALEAALEEILAYEEQCAARAAADWKPPTEADPQRESGPALSQARLPGWLERFEAEQAAFVINGDQRGNIGRVEGFRAQVVLSPAQPADRLELFGDTNKEHLARLIALCRAGGFLIL